MMSECVLFNYKTNRKRERVIKERVALRADGDSKDWKEERA
jgi:hypothetical protein